jgi:hypothetical protein
MNSVEPWELVDRDSYPDMNYLMCEGARTRYLIAAHHLRDCDTVVEIGGFKTPITGFLTRVPERVLVVDPLIRGYSGTSLRGEPCRLEHVASTFQDYHFDLEPHRYGFVMLGLSLKHFSAHQPTSEREWRKLRGLLQDASVAVIEWSVAWPLGRDLGERLLAELKAETVVDLELDLGRSPGMDTERHRRRVLVLKPVADGFQPPK